ncbi:MAG: 50S ribosomal protein L32 [Kiritimatiellia bacterium]
MAAPKRRSSKMKKRLRRSSHIRPLPTVNVCTECGEPSQPHRVCRSCGQYAGRQVLTLSLDD